MLACSSHPYLFQELAPEHAHGGDLVAGNPEVGGLYGIYHHEGVLLDLILFDPADRVAEELAKDPYILTVEIPCHHLNKACRHKPASEDGVAYSATVPLGGEI